MTTLLRAIVTSLLVLVMPHTIPASSRADDRAQSVLTARNARKVDEAIERGLAWIASQQKPNGAFPAVQSFEPGATSVCLFAFLELAMAGQDETKMARQTGQWLLQRGFKSPSEVERFYVTGFYCSQAMFQLGGDYWSEFYPMLEQAPLPLQRPDGQWDVKRSVGSEYGGVLTNALAILALTAPYQLLPVLQR
jgi:hypothetical protein